MLRITIRGGTYYETAAFNGTHMAAKLGTAEEPFVFRGMPGERVKSGKARASQSLSGARIVSNDPAAGNVTVLGNIGAGNTSTYIIMNCR